MELTMNTNSFTFTDCPLMNGKLNKNVGLTLKRLQAKHRNKSLKFQKWFSMEHDYCIPIKIDSKNDNDIEENDGYLEKTTKFESDFSSLNSFKMAANSVKINVNYEHNSNAYANDITTELMKDTLLKNQSKYNESNVTSKSCNNTVGSCSLSITNQRYCSYGYTNPRSLNNENFVQLSDDEKSCDSKEPVPQKSFSSMDMDSDMIKLFPNLDFSTEHISDEKFNFTENRETNTDSIILYKNQCKTEQTNLLSNSLGKTMPKSPKSLQIENVKNVSQTDTVLPNNFQRLFAFNSTNITKCHSASEQYLSILNRYQVKSNMKFIEQVENPEPKLLRNLLQGSPKPKTVISPYTQRHLKPYILRDPGTKPLWLQMLNELKEHYRKKKGLPLYTEVETIDYSYVRAKHIASVNALARQFFWPGIDFTESLMYPDFSVVALYKNLIIGFGFMVPDIKTNENYITFLFTRPCWTNCGIAKFMIYHLIQTCMTRDITLHVSPNSPAIILYQKFGFKIEEFVQNFYENYFPADSELSKNALFLRLRSTLQRK